jgi:tetratricopeptide (TPR) repeat protein
MRRIFVMILGVLLIAGLTSCAKDPVRDDFERADKLCEKEHYEEAAEMFREIAILNPHSDYASQGLFRSGMINYLYLKKYEDAVEDFAYLVYYYPDDKLAFDSQAAIVDIYMNKMGNYAQAIVELRKLIENYPSHDEIDQYQYKLARCYYFMRDFDQARLEYLILLDTYHRTKLKPDVYFDIANTYYVEGGGKVDKAIEYYRKLIDDYPSSPLVMEAMFYNAAALEEKGDLDEALKAYEELLPVYPNPSMVALRIEGIKGIIQKKAAPAPMDDSMGLGSTEEGELTEGSGDEKGPTAVGDNEKPDGIIIKKPDKKKEPAPNTTNTAPDTVKKETAP